MRLISLRRARSVGLIATFVVVSLPAQAGAMLGPPTVLLVMPPSGALGFGGAVAGLGDVDGDGTADAVIGAPGSGHAYVISGVRGTVLHDIADPAGTGFDFGASIDAVGDVDGDGVSDFAVGAPSRLDPDRGRVFLYSGATGAALVQLVATAGHLAFGQSVAGAGDLSGDGVPDVTVGAPAPAHGGGTVFAFSGADGAQLWSRQEPSVPPELQPSFGELVVATPDVSGDGIADVLVSARSVPSGVVSSGVQPVTSASLAAPEPATSPVAAARVDVLSGADGGVVRSISGPGAGKNDTFGAAVAAVGDQDDDGVVDHLIGEGGGGQLHLYSGGNGGLVRSITAPAGTQGQGISALAGVNDTDGDGRSDVWVGIPSAGAAYLVNGTGAVLATVTAASPQGTFGAAVGAVDNIGAGGGDLVVGDPTAPGGGAVYLLRAGPMVAPVADMGTDRDAACVGVACLSASGPQAQAPGPVSTTVPTTTPAGPVSSTASLPKPAGATPATPAPTTAPAGPVSSTAVLPKPASDAPAQGRHPHTGGGERLGGLVALVLGMAGVRALDRVRASARREPPATTEGHA